MLKETTKEEPVERVWTSLPVAIGNRDGLNPMEQIAEILSNIQQGDMAILEKVKHRRVENMPPAYDGAVLFVEDRTLERQIVIAKNGRVLFEMYCTEPGFIGNIPHFAGLAYEAAKQIVRGMNDAMPDVVQECPKP